MQQLYQLGCDWTDNGCIFLHKGGNVLMNSIDIVTNVPPLKTVSNVQIHTYYIATIPLRRTGKYTISTTCIFDVEIY